MKYTGGPVFFVPRLVVAVLRRFGAFWSTAIHRVALDGVGAGTRFRWGVRFSQPSVVRFGRDCYVASGVVASADLPHARLEVGDNVQINERVHLDTTGGLTIENGVLISEDAVVYTHDHGLDPRSIPVPVPKTIAAGSWVGMRAVILPGCTRIGRNAIIGAGAVVTRDVPDDVIVAGSPARVVRRREFTYEASLEKAEHTASAE